MSRSYDHLKVRGMFPEELECVDWIMERLKPLHIEALMVLSAPDTEREWFTAKEVELSPRLLWSLNDFARGDRGCESPLSLATWQDGRPREWTITGLGLECLARAKANEVP
jgi:hypothetical protein